MKCVYMCGCVWVWVCACVRELTCAFWILNFLKRMKNMFMPKQWCVPGHIKHIQHIRRSKQFHSWTARWFWYKKSSIFGIEKASYRPADGPTDTPSFRDARTKKYEFLNWLHASSHLYNGGEKNDTNAKTQDAFICTQLLTNWGKTWATRIF